MGQRHPLHRVPFAEDRATYLRIDVREAIDHAALANVDWSAGTLSLKLRAWQPPASGKTASDYVIDDAFTKASAYVFEGHFTPTAVTGELELELVLIDSAVTSQPTPSTYRERVIELGGLLSWTTLVSPTVQP